MKVKNFQGFIKTRKKLNESESDDYGLYGANPEKDEFEADDDMPAELEDMEDDGEDMEEEEKVTLEDLKAMVDELTERVESLEGGDEEEEDMEEGDMEEEE